MTACAADDDMVPTPARGRCFGVEEVRPGLADCAPSGRMRLDAMARWFQDIASADVEDAGVADDAFWILRRTRIRVERFPVINEPCLIRTFCSGIGRLVAERRTVISPAGRPDEHLVDAVALWVHLDPRTRRPSNVTAEEIAVFSTTGYGNRRISHRLTHPRPELTAGSALFDWQFRRIDCDVADHVNNAAYWELVEEELLAEGTDPLTVDAELEFRDGAQPGQAHYFADGEDRHGRFILNAEDELLATLTLNTGLVGGA